MGREWRRWRGQRVSLSVCKVDGTSAWKQGVKLDDATLGRVLGKNALPCYSFSICKMETKNWDLLELWRMKMSDITFFQQMWGNGQLRRPIERSSQGGRVGKPWAYLLSDSLKSNLFAEQLQIKKTGTYQKRRLSTTEEGTTMRWLELHYSQGPQPWVGDPQSGE